MTRVFQKIDCPIDGKSVTVTLRSGHNLLERGTPYVWCSERDCQYVDTNTAPCPLRVDMFDDGHDYAVLREYLAGARTQFCYACLVDGLGLTHESVRRSARRLQREVGAKIQPGRCEACGHRRLTIIVRTAMP